MEITNLNIKNEYNPEERTYNLCLDDLFDNKTLHKNTGVYDYLDGYWIMVKSYDEFIDVFTRRYMSNELPGIISFGMDLTSEHNRIHDKFFGSDKSIPLYELCKEKTGLHAFRYIIKFFENGDLILPKILFHSSNAYAVALMKKELTLYYDRKDISYER